MDHVENLCTEFEQQLPLYVGRDLEPELLVALERHAAACALCTARAHAAVTSRSVLVRGLTHARRGPAVDLWSDVRGRLREEGVLAPPAHFAHARRFARFAGFGTAAAAMLMVGFWLGSREPGADLDSRGAATIAQPPSSPQPRGSQPANTPIFVNAASVVEDAPIVPTSFQSVAGDESLATSSSPGLRRVAPTEERLRDGAKLYLEQPWIELPSSYSMHDVAPVGLQQRR